jgi:hypothetical protein
VVTAQSEADLLAVQDRRRLDAAARHGAGKATDPDTSRTGAPGWHPGP